MRIGIDVLGNIVILKFDRDAKISDRKKFALDFLKKHKNVKTVLEKVGKFSGRLRTQKTKWLAGEKTKEVLYKENGCEFRFNVDTCYFSPRLSTERKEIAGMVKKDERVLVMFGGVAPFAVVIGKMSKVREIVSVEIGKECSRYARMNVKRNKLENVEIVQGDVRKKCRKELIGKFDRIIMARPNLKDSFLDVAFSLVKNKGLIHYYGFYHEMDLQELKDLVKLEAEKAGKKIKILRVKKAGDIGAFKYRYRVDFRVS
jgi:tRNA (guanine37-N1)-methyltransferase